MAESLKGAERIQELMEAFPAMPRSIVLKTDAVREGMRHTPVMDQLGTWAIPDTHAIFEFDHDETHSVDSASHTHPLAPIMFHFKSGIGVRVMFDNDSPYEVRYEGFGQYRLYRDGDAMEEVFFPPKPNWLGLRTSSGKLMSTVMELRGETCLYLAPSTYCEYFGKELGCTFCNINPTGARQKEMGMERLTVKRGEDVTETYIAAAREDVDGRINHVELTGGAFLDRKKEADLYVNMVQAIQRGIEQTHGSSKKVRITAAPQALDEEGQRRIRDAGATSMCHPMEVWDKRLFEIICPGKTQNVGWEGWLEAVVRNVDIYGWGSAITTFVGGVEMAQPWGFKTMDEALESTLSGFEYLAQRGVRAGFILWRRAPGSRLQDLQRPPTEYALRLELGRHQLSMKYGLYRGDAYQPPVHPGCSSHRTNMDWVHLDPSLAS